MTKPRSLRLADFSIDPPDAWNGELIASGPPEGGFRPNLVAVTHEVPVSETAKTFAARVLEQTRASVTEYKVLKEGSANFGAIRGYLREHTFVQGKVKVGQFQLYVVSEGLARTFTFSTLASKLEASRRIAEGMFSSIKIYGGKGPERVMLGSVRG